MLIGPGMEPPKLTLFPEGLDELFIKGLPSGMEAAGDVEGVKKKEEEDGEVMLECASA